MKRSINLFMFFIIIISSVLVFATNSIPSIDSFTLNDVSDITNELVWEISDDVSLDNYALYRDGELLEQRYLEGLNSKKIYNDFRGYGSKNYTLIVTDKEGNSVSKTIYSDGSTGFGKSNKTYVAEDNLSAPIIDPVVTTSPIIVKQNSSLDVLKISIGVVLFLIIILLIIYFRSSKSKKRRHKKYK